MSKGNLEKCVQIFNQLDNDAQEQAIHLLEMLASGNEADREHAAMVASISTLPEPVRTMMTLRFVDGLKWTEVARKTGYSESSVYKMYAKAKALIRA